MCVFLSLLAAMLKLIQNVDACQRMCRMHVWSIMGAIIYMPPSWDHAFRVPTTTLDVKFHFHSKIKFISRQLRTFLLYCTSDVHIFYIENENKVNNLSIAIGYWEIIARSLYRRCMHESTPFYKVTCRFYIIYLICRDVFMKHTLHGYINENCFVFSRDGVCHWRKLRTRRSIVFYPSHIIQL
jgi:hypothetical protein